MDLGYKPEAPPEPSETSTSDQETRYPSLDLHDDSVDKLKGDHQCAVGDEYYADGVRLRVKEVSDTEYGKRLSFDVMSIDEFEPAESAPGEEKESDEPADKPAKNGKKLPKAIRGGY